MQTSSAVPPPAAESQRHDFILHYYDMAVRDLERHLGIGWQTLGAVAGAFVSLSLAQKNELPVPIAVAAAFTIAGWGLLNVIDSNLWALRAIAFLANVESVYFGDDDRRRFNPYVGQHPPFKLMNSLRYQAYVASCFGGISVLYYWYSIMRRARWSIMIAWQMKNRLPFWDAVFWSLPSFVALFFIVLIIGAQTKHLSEYRDFVRDAPGSGLFIGAGTSDATPATYRSGESVQEAVLVDLERRMTSWRRYRKYGIAACVAVGLLIAILLLLGSLYY